MKKILIPIGVLLITSLAHAQNLPNTENYVQTRTYLEPVTTSSSGAKQIHTVQYFDGLGRPKQVVNVKASPLGRDIVTPITYDGFGRQTRDYLPVPQLSTSNGAIYTQAPGLADFPIGDPTNTYTNERAFSEKVLENSPLDRPQQQIQVGTDWASKPVKFEYDTNNNVDYVRKYETTTTWDPVGKMMLTSVQLLQYFPIAQLYKNTIIDEDGNRTIEFKNGKGQTLLVRKVISPTENADTYYVYNEYDVLAYVIPPLASAPTVEPDTVENLYYQYRYDGRKRLVEKKVPGKGWEYLVYDKADRLVLTQDTVMKSQSKWLMTKYDTFGRVVYTAIISGGERANMQSQAEVNSIVEKRDNSGFTLNGMQIQYTNNYFHVLEKVLIVNYYDTYPSYDFNPSFPTSLLGGGIPLTSTPSATDGKTTKGLPVMSLVKNIEDDNWTKNYSYYDTRGRAVGSYSINHLGGYTKTESKLDFAGVPQNTVTKHVRRDGEPEITVKERFVYDNQNRLLKHYHQVDYWPEELLAENSYDELSQLTTKKIGSSDNGAPLQSVDYAYNIRGWMTDINKTQMSLPDLGGKLFSYKIKYNEKQGIDNPDPAKFSGKNVMPKYNGNIAEVDWRSVSTIGDNPPLEAKRYGYAYDGLSRLSAGYYQNPLNPYSKENIESLTYDLNGNITNLYRTSVLQGTIATEIDDLQYFYTGNQANRIKDNSGNKTGYEGVAGFPIEYDANGNMISMPDKQITGIGYNHLNLANNVNIGAGQVTTDISTKYRADGEKVRKENINTSIGFSSITWKKEITDYIDGFQYLNITNSDNGGGSSEMFSATPIESRYAFEQQAFSLDRPIIIQDPTIGLPIGGSFPPVELEPDNPVGTIKNPHNPELQFFPTAEGYYDYQRKQYIYQYKDHLGNVRVSYTRNNIAGGIEITDNNDYYPFGMNHLKTGNAYFGAGKYQNYKYNGKELQETGMYDYGARMYMADLGRWGVVDPKSQYTHESYSYVWNNPIRFNDPTGMQGEEVGGGKCPPACPSGVSAITILPSGEKETKIQEVIVIGKGKSNNSGPGSLAMAALLVSQADSPVPGPADIVAAGMLIGAGVWWTYNQFIPPSTGYTTIADPGAGYGSMKTEDNSEEDKDVNGQDVPEEGKRRKNRIPDKGEPNTVETNDPETTSKKYGPDGNVEKEYNKGHGPNYPKNEQDDHIHDYKPNPRNPSGRGDRQTGRPPKKGELLRDFGIRK